MKPDETLQKFTAMSERKKRDMKMARKTTCRKLSPSTSIPCLSLLDYYFYNLNKHDDYLSLLFILPRSLFVHIVVTEKDEAPSIPLFFCLITCFHIEDV